MDATAAITELRHIEKRILELDKEKNSLVSRKLALLELDQGTRKSHRKTLSPEQGKALIADLIRRKQ